MVLDVPFRTATSALPSALKSAERLEVAAA
jgi:hypothetical protein